MRYRARARDRMIASRRYRDRGSLRLPMIGDISASLFADMLGPSRHIDDWRAATRRCRSILRRYEIP